MKHVGAYEAKTHLPELLERVAKGERITITKHGTPVAILTPAGPQGRKSHSQTITELHEFRKGRKRGRSTLRSMIDAGRR